MASVAEKPGAAARALADVPAPPQPGPAPMPERSDEGKAPAGPPGPAAGQFLRNLNRNWASPKLYDYIRAQPEQIRSTLAFTNRIAFVGSPALGEALSRYAALEILPDSAAAASLSERAAPVELVLIEGCWLRRDDPWRDALLDSPSGSAATLHALLEGLRARGVPSALWLTEEAEAIGDFAHLFPLVDRVFVAAGPPSPGVLPPGMVPLPPGVDVKRFNPFKPDRKQHRRDGELMRFLVDGAFELAQRHGPEGGERLLDPLLGYMTWLLDSSYAQRNNSVRLSAALRRRFAGCFFGADLAFLLRQATALFLPGALVRTRPVHALRRTLEAAASKTLVLTDGLLPAQAATANRLEGLEPGALEPLLAALGDDVVGTLALQHLGWRQAVAEHSHFERLATILRALGIEPRPSQSFTPSVNLVMPTIRPELVAQAIRCFDGLRYPDKRFSIVLNGGTLPPEVARLIEAREDIALRSVPSYKTIGYCINAGIDLAESDYWAKIDDDDVYGPEFLADLMLQRRYLDFDVTGKGAVFGYHEEDDRMQLRWPEVVDLPHRYLAGGTLLVKNPGRHFPEDVRGYADTLFLSGCVDRGDLVVAGDPFNFVQVRRRDLASHTWTMGASRLDRQGPTRSGLDFAHVVL